MDVNYESEPSFIKKEYKDIVKFLENQTKAKHNIKKCTFYENQLLIISREKPDIMAYQTLICDAIINSKKPDTPIGFQTYDVEKNVEQYATTINRNADDPIQYLYIYYYILDVPEKTYEMANVTLDKIKYESFDYSSDTIAIALISIISEYLGKTIQDDELYELSNTDSIDFDICRRDLISEIENID